MRALRRNVFHWLEPGEQANPWEQVVDFLLILMILGSVVIVVLQSMPEMAEHDRLLDEAERWCVYFFTLEYLLRVWTSVELDRYAGKSAWRARLKYLMSPMALVDLASILPFYVAAFADANTVVIRLLRIFRLIRVVKFGRYHSSMGMLARVVKSRREEMLISIMLVLALVVIASTLVYAVERDAQPKAFPSIPAAMWWGVVTMTTVGYGDVYPITPAGKFIAGVSVLLGVGLFALPAGILSGGFAEELARRRAAEAAAATAAHPSKCPHCGKDLAPQDPEARPK
jgi:voltage-gated potassium channel